MIFFSLLLSADLFRAATMALLSVSRDLGSGLSIGLGIDLSIRLSIGLRSGSYDP